MKDLSLCPYFEKTCKTQYPYLNDKGFTCAYPYMYELCHYYNEQKRKDEETMDNKTIEKTLDMAGNISRIAANLSEPKKENPKPYNQSDDNSNNASTGTQSVNIALDTGKKREPKPVEKHIHTFPENRSLTSEECELDLKKAQMQYELQKTQQAHQIECDKLNWKHQIEQERKAEKHAKICRIFGGILVAAGLTGLGYSIYADYRDHKSGAAAQTALPKADNITAEGTVK